LGFDPASASASASPKLKEADVRAVLDAFALEVEDPLFGLRIAAEIQYGSFGIFPYLGMTAPTVGDSLVSVSQFSHLLDGVTTIECHVSGGEVAMIVRGADPQHFGLHGDLLFFAAVSHHLEKFCGRPIGLECAWLPYELREKRRLMETIRMGSCEMLQSSAGLVLSQEVANRPLLTADPILHEILREHGTSLSSAALTSTSYRTVLSDLIRKMFAEGLDVTTATVARRSGMSIRTMQRRLQEENTSFDALVEATSSQLSYQLLSSGQSVADVAYALQYEDVSAFIRAFRRWTGMTPGDVARTSSASQRRRTDA
jgi:AraC-like DNA-binding protein